MELSGLTGDCEYEVRIRAMNSQGWSPLSSSFIFRTSGIQYTTTNTDIIKSKYLNKYFNVDY